MERMTSSVNLYAQSQLFQLLKFMSEFQSAKWCPSSQFNHWPCQMQTMTSIGPAKRGFMWLLIATLASLYSVNSVPSNPCAQNAQNPNGGPVVVVETEKCFGRIRKCPNPKRISDAELSACFTEIFLEMRPLFASGIPEIDLKSIDPYILDHFEYTFNIPPVVATLRFSNISLRGLSAFDHADFKFDTRTRHMRFTLATPILRFHAYWHEIDGNLPTVYHFIGSGPVSADLRGGHLVGDATFKIERDAGGREIVQIDQMKMSLDYDDGVIEIGGIFGKTRILKPVGGFVAGIVDRYQHELHSLIRPAFEKQVSEIAKKVANRSVAKMNFLADFF